MFHYKITVRAKVEGRDLRRSSHSTFHEFTKFSYVGDYVAGQASRREVTSVSVTKISQAAYVRATRGE